MKRNNSAKDPPTNKSIYRIIIRSLCAITVSVCLLSIIISSISYFRDARDQIKQQNLLFLKQYQQVVNDNADSVLRIALRISEDNSVKKFMSHPQDIGLYDRKNIIDLLEDYVLVNSNIHSIYVSYDNSDMVYTSFGTYDKAFLNTLPWIKDKESYKQLTAKMIWLPEWAYNINITTDLNGQRVLALLLRVPISKNSTSASIIMCLHSDAFFGYVESEYVGIYNFFAVFDKESQNIYYTLPSHVLSSDMETVMNGLSKDKDLVSSGEHTLNVSKWIVSTVTSSDRNWVFLAAYSLAELYPQLFSLLRKLLIITGVMLILSFVIDYSMARYLYSPWKHLLNEFQQEGTDSSSKKSYMEFETLSSQFKKTFTHNAELVQTIDEMMPRLQRRFVSDLLYGYYDEEELIRQQMITLNLTDKPNLFTWCLAIVAINNEDRFSTELSTREQVVTGHSILFLLVTELKKNGFIAQYSQMNRFHFAVLIGIPTSRATSAEKELTPSFDHFLMEEKEKVGSFTVGIICGELFHSLEHSSDIFSNLSKIQQIVPQNDSYVFLDSIQSEMTQHNIYVLQNVTSNIKTALHSSKEALQDIIFTQKKYIEEQLFVRSENTHYLSVQLTMLLNEMLMDEEIILEGTSISVEPIAILLLSSDMPDNVLKEHIKDITDVLRNAMQAKHNRNESFVSNVIEFIENNYNTDIGLTEISEYLSYTPAYINRILKTSTGHTFYEILTEFRMEKAKSLLTQTSLGLAEISSQVGYINQQSFIRAFKNTIHMTPTQFRNSSK